MKKAALNSNQLKLIAIAAMTLDHLVWTICPGYSRVWWVLLAHIIGRLTAPIMWYFIAEGYHYTHDVKKYAGRLFLLALISHFAYNFCFGISFIPFQTSVFNQTSVAWSLAWGLVLLCVNNSDKLKSWQKTVIILLVCVITFPSDWSCIASMAILFIGSYRGNFRKQMLWMMFWTLLYALVYFFFIDRVYALVQLGTCLTIPLLRLYNGERGSWKGMGKLFYAYYPAHLAACESGALPEVQRADALRGVYLVSAYGIQVAVFRIEGHLQESLYAVYMEQRLRSPAPEHPAYRLGVVHGADLVIHLHHGYKAGVRGDEALQPFQVYHAGIVYRRFDNVVLAGKGFIYLIYRRMLGRADYYPAPAPHCFKGSEYCHIVALGAA